MKTEKFYKYPEEISKELIDKFGFELGKDDFGYEYYNKQYGVIIHFETDDFFKYCTAEISFSPVIYMHRDGQAWSSGSVFNYMNRKPLDDALLDYANKIYDTIAFIRKLSKYLQDKKPVRE